MGKRECSENSIDGRFSFPVKKVNEILLDLDVGYG